jgi:hypothetical protein
MNDYYESQPGSWLVVICERSENRGSGGVAVKRAENGVNRCGVLGPRKATLH